LESKKFLEALKVAASCTNELGYETRFLVYISKEDSKEGETYKLDEESEKLIRSYNNFFVFIQKEEEEEEED